MTPSEQRTPFHINAELRLKHSYSQYLADQLADCYFEFMRVLALACSFLAAATVFAQTVSVEPAMPTTIDRVRFLIDTSSVVGIPSVLRFGSFILLTTGLAPGPPPFPVQHVVEVGYLPAGSYTWELRIEGIRVASGVFQVAEAGAPPGWADVPTLGAAFTVVLCTLLATAGIIVARRVARAPHS